ncbi:hypothetical protein NB693_23190 [Pantoea ananatis]|uniref:hypothetical protein n=1 Tax=Pantoea ananas TaxID=553 RepID=UPI00221EE391|nr:hypothetical protein [Pantoea ananatis]
MWFGFYGQIDTAVVEVSGIREDGSLIPSTSVGNNKTWLDLAKKVIVEVNDWQPAGIDGMHDVYYGTALPPQRKPIPLLHADDRIGEPSLRCDRIVIILRTQEISNHPEPLRGLPPRQRAQHRAQLQD